MEAPATAFGPKDFGATDPKVIVIGFNRCGTTSLHRMFLESGVPSIHFQDDDNANIAKRILSNIGMGLAPLHGYEDIRVFSDMTFVNKWLIIEGVRLFRDLHCAYPDAYFILNTRPVEGWIASRVHHSEGRYLDRCIKASGLSKDALLDQWRVMFAQHIQEVTDYFRDNPRFLKFDITTGNPQAIADFVAPDFIIDVSRWKHRNKRPPLSGASSTPKSSKETQTTQHSDRVNL